MLSRPLTYIINRETRRTQARARVSGKPPTRPGVERDKTGKHGIRYESERHVYETNARFIHVPWRSCPVYPTRFSYGDAETNGRYRLLEQMIWKTPSVHRSPLRNTYPEAVTRAKRATYTLADCVGTWQMCFPPRGARWDFYKSQPLRWFVSWFPGIEREVSRTPRTENVRLGHPLDRFVQVFHWFSC